MARYIGWWVRRVNLAKDDNKMPSDIYPLPTDPEKPTAAPITKEDKQKLYEKGQERLQMLSGLGK